MIYSMTAYARGQTTTDYGSLDCEIRSINHRYLEISLHLPEGLRILEMALRDSIRQHIKRGKVECSVRYQPNPNLEGHLFNINSILAQELCRSSEKIASFLPESALINPVDILRFPGVLETKEMDIRQLQTDVFKLLEKTIKDLVVMRAREGEDLKHLFTERMKLIKDELSKVREHLPNVLNETENRLHRRFAEAKIELDPMRLEQEMLLFLQRVDIAEEIERIETHITEVKRILEEGGVVGRRFDFLLQELNREANTLGSKSIHPAITHAAVEMKVLIEQMREQVQNIE